MFNSKLATYVQNDLKSLDELFAQLTEQPTFFLYKMVPQQKANYTTMCETVKPSCRYCILEFI